jgi:TPR repeat protein
VLNAPRLRPRSQPPQWHAAALCLMFLAMRARKRLLLLWMLLECACTSRESAGQNHGDSPAKPRQTSSSKKVQPAVSDAPTPTVEQAAELARRGRAALRAHNEKDAASYLEQACNGGELSACSLFAELLDDGRGVPENPARARELFEQACAGGLQSACDRLGH